MTVAEIYKTVGTWPRLVGDCTEIFRSVVFEPATLARRKNEREVNDSRTSFVT